MRALARLPHPHAGRIPGSALPGWARENPETAVQMAAQLLENQEALLQLAGEWGADPSPPSVAAQEMDVAAYTHLLGQMREMVGKLKGSDDVHTNFLGDVLEDVLRKPQVVELLAEVIRREQ